jgi:signal peptidase I
MAPVNPLIEARLRANLPRLAPAPEEKDRSRGFLGLSASLLCPGLGHVIAGYFNLGAICFIVMWMMAVSVLGTLVLPQYFPYLIILAPVAALLHFLQCMSAARCCRKSSAELLGDRGIRFGAAFLCVTLAVLWQHQTTVYLRDHIAEIGYCPTSSMAPTIVPGDFFLVVRNHPFDRWDVVALNSPLSTGPSQLAKRVVGMPGDLVEITGDGLVINGELMRPPADVDRYIPVDRWDELMPGPDPINAATGCWGKPIQLGMDEYFVLGDNSPASDDSRFFPAVEGYQVGAVPKDQIIGRVMCVLWPPGHWRKFY